MNALANSSAACGERDGVCAAAVRIADRLRMQVAPGPVILRCLRDEASAKSSAEVENKKSKMKCAFVADVDTWGSGGQMLDVLVLKDGRIVAIMESRLAVYDNEQAFEAGTPRGIIEL
jgi:hypothetical protein